MIQIISDLIAGEHIFILVHTLEIHVQTMTFISLDKSGRGWAGLDAPNHKDSLKKKITVTLFPVKSDDKI